MQGLSTWTRRVSEPPVASRMLRVLLYSATNPAEAGGVQSALRLLERGLTARGHDVSMSWNEAGVLGRHLRLMGSDGWHGPPSQFWSLTRALQRLRPDIVNVHFLTGQAAYFRLLAPLLGFRLVLSAHGSDLLRTRPRLRMALPWIARGADALTVVSRELLGAALALPGLRGNRLHRIENGVDLAFWSGQPRREAWEPFIFAAGRLEWVKGFDLLLETFAQVRALCPNIKLELAGAGHQAEPLRQLASRLDVLDAVTFCGRLTAEQMRAKLSRAHAFVLPSRREGLPLSLLEAMAAGAPVVASAVGGVPEAADTAALLTPPQDTMAQADALVRLLDDAALRRRLSAAGRVRAMRYGDAAMAGAYERLYLDLYDRRAAHPGGRP